MTQCRILLTPDFRINKTVCLLIFGLLFRPVNPYLEVHHLLLALDLALPLLINKIQKTNIFAVSFVIWMGGAQADHQSHAYTANVYRE